MINRIQLKEVLAWGIVLIALVLFSVTIAFAQETTINVSSENGKVHIRTKTVENGKTISRDTVFEAKDDADIDAIIESFTGESGKDKNSAKKEVRIHGDRAKKKNKVIIDMDLPELSDSDRREIEKEIQKSMDEMHEGMKEMRKSLRNMSIHINGDGDENGFRFEFDNGGDFHFFDSDLDSLRDEEHVVIVGDEKEQPPVLEKVINKNGKQVFVYKRVNPEKSLKSKDEWISGFSIYPNPGSGKFTMKFKVPESHSVNIAIADAKGKSVYSESLKEYSGSYSKEVDLTKYGKGAYVITISDDGNSLTKKIIVE